jgi:RecJ-like exonuclease
MQVVVEELQLHKELEQVLVEQVVEEQEVQLQEAQQHLEHLILEEEVELVMGILEKVDQVVQESLL